MTDKLHIRLRTVAAKLSTGQISLTQEEAKDVILMIEARERELERFRRARKLYALRKKGLI